MRKYHAGFFLNCFKKIKLVQIESHNDFGNPCHIRSSEPYFYESAYLHNKCDVVFPINNEGQLVISEIYLANNAGKQNSELPEDKRKKHEEWKCCFQCRPVTESEIGAIIALRKAFDMEIKHLRKFLHTCDDCPNEHYTKVCITTVKHPTDSKLNEIHYTPKYLRGHPLLCFQNTNCVSKARILRAASTHYPVLRHFLRYFDLVMMCHFRIHKIDAALTSADFRSLMEMTHCTNFNKLCDDFDLTDETGGNNPSLTNPKLESYLQIHHAKLIDDLQKQIDDYPLNACCSCERLFQRRSVTAITLNDDLGSDVWSTLKNFILQHDPLAPQNTLFICKYCKPLIKSNTLPPRCVLNGLQTVPIPPELKKLDPLSSQLLQRAKCFQTIVRLGTYTKKVPVYNSLKACKGTMFFLPLPLSKTVDTLQLVQDIHSDKLGLPDPELYIILNGKPTKSRVIWRSLVDVNLVNTALLKLKEINWLYKGVNSDAVDETAKHVIEVTSTATSTMLEKATSTEIAGFETYTIRNLDNKLSTQSDTEQYKLLNIKEDPLDNRLCYLDVLCFPVLFPTGEFGEHHPRQVRLTHSEYVKSRLLNKDSRFRKCPQYVFYLLWQKEMREIAAGVYNMLNSKKGQQMSVKALLSKVDTSDEQLEANLCTMLQSVRGTKQFWFMKRSELRCMIRELGTPTLFLTFSCAEYESADIADYLRKVNNMPSTYTNIAKLCTEDPISVSRKFSLKFHAFFNTVICKGKVLGEVEHFYWKKEYQARGAPHYHALLWIRDAPIIGKHDPDQILKWIQARITCHIPDPKTCPELNRLVTRYQTHRCSAYCRRKRKVGSVFVTRCKFGFPREACEIAELNDIEESLKSRKRIYQLARTKSETKINDYNPLLLLLWKANTDIQFVSESSLALAHYVSGYVTKAERSNMQDVWQDVSENKGIYSRLWSFGLRCLRSRECGLYEASDLLLGDHLYEKSDTVYWIDVCMPQKRKRRLKNYKDIQSIAKIDPDSENIFKESVHQDHYPQRPKKLDNLCLYDFVANYDWYGRDDVGNRVYRKLTKPRLPNHKLFDPENENQREDYYYSLILLFVPFREESSLLLKDETAEEAFRRLLLTNNTGCSAHHAKLQKILQAQSNIKKINIARQDVDEQKPTSKDDDDLQLMGEAKTAMQEVLDMNVNLGKTLSLQDRVGMLNADQSRIFRDVNNHLLHQQMHEANQCKCAFKPLCMFVSGVGGTGKSFLIEAIKLLVNSLWPSPDLTCAIAAPTGLAAFNIHGITIHRLFQLPIEHESKPATYWPLSKDSQKVMKTSMRNVKLIVIDEVSMVSSLTLAYIHLRLEELFGGEHWFGSKNMLFVGDILQLPPVNGRPVFEKVTQKSVINKLGCTTAVNIWKDCIVYDELTINERQKQDQTFSSLLDSVRCGFPTDDTIRTLQQCVIKGSVPDKFAELEQTGLSPVCLFPTRKACDDFNTEMLNRLTSPIKDILCVDKVDKSASSCKWNKKAATQLQKLNSDCNMTAGLEARLTLAVGARVMLRRNIDTKAGLVNGAIGTVRAITASTVNVLFDHTSQPYNIEMVRTRFMLMKNYYVYRKQFPLILAYAVTIHKCQGLSLDCAIVDLSEQVFSVGMAYVALSRVKTLSGLHLVAFDPKSIMVSESGLIEVNRLRHTYRSDLPLYSIPVKPKMRNKRKLTGTTSTDQPATKKPRLAKTSPNNTKKPVQGDHVPPSKKFKECVLKPPKQVTNTAQALVPCQVQANEPPVKNCTPCNTAHRDHHESPYKFHTVDEQWQVNACSTLGVRFVRCNRLRPGGPNVSLKPPDTHTIRRITGDGNCLFRSFSYIITGSEEQHMAVRQAICNHMVEIAHFLFATGICSTYTSIQEYIQSTKMDQDQAWGTEVEMFTLAHLLTTSVFSYNTAENNWWRYSPHFVDRSLPEDVTAMAMYIRYLPGHFDVVRSILK